jgi:hypothetical protein
MNIGNAIRRKCLKELQQHRKDHDATPHCARPRPSDEDQQREPEIAKDVVELPTEARTELHFGGTQGGKYDQKN